MGWKIQYNSITSWICSNMEMESHILFWERLISAEERTLCCLNLFFVNVGVVTTLKINCKAQGKGKGLREGLGKASLEIKSS